MFMEPFYPIRLADAAGWETLEARFLSIKSSFDASCRVDYAMGRYNRLVDSVIVEPN
jgi:hypothetical protein